MADKDISADILENTRETDNDFAIYILKSKMANRTLIKRLRNA